MHEGLKLEALHLSRPYGAFPATITQVLSDRYFVVQLDDLQGSNTNTPTAPTEAPSHKAEDQYSTSNHNPVRFVAHLGGAEWSAKARIRPSHPPAASLVFGLLDSVLTPGSGGGGGESVLEFKQHLNAVFPDIQLTMEEEENNQPAFLDVLFCRKDCSGLKTKVFRKATSTTQVLNYNSNRPIRHKRICIRALYQRVQTHYSEPEDEVDELQYFRRVFKANGYPRNLVNQCSRKLDERQNPTDPKSWRAVPYVKNASNAVSRLPAPLGIGIAHRPEETIRRQIVRRKTNCHGRKHLESFTGSGAVLGKATMSEKRGNHSGRYSSEEEQRQLPSRGSFDGTQPHFQVRRSDNRVSRKMLESWFSGPQSPNKRNDLPLHIRH
ncbi:transcription corepressor activity [Sparganum proliferum]